MKRPRADRSTLSSLGERGFLRSLLPRLRRADPARFLVPPGDDAVVLRGSRHVLSIDGLTEGTHFRMSWDERCRRIGGFPLARGLGWKLLGSSLSDLAAMGDTRDRWAMVYLGGPGRLRASFLNDFDRGLREAAARYRCALAGGDTVRAEHLTLVAAVGGRAARRPLVRSGARIGDALAVVGTVGDAAAGLAVLDRKVRASAADARFLVRRFFAATPQFPAGARLAAHAGVHAMLDLSDSLDESVRLLCEASDVGARLELDAVPVSAAVRRTVGVSPDLLGGGEDYGLLFSAAPAAVAALRAAVGCRVIGTIVPKKRGVVWTRSGAPLKAVRSFAQFS